MSRVARTVFDHLGRDPTIAEVKAHIIDFFEKQDGMAILHKLSGGGRCVYLTDDGKKCAVGCLLNDVEAAQAWDMRSQSDFSTIVGQAKRGLVNISPPGWMMQGEMLVFLSQTQRIHDKTALNKEHFFENRKPAFLNWLRGTEVPNDATAS